jgi:hypothetical protein
MAKTKQKQKIHLKIFQKEGFWCRMEQKVNYLMYPIFNFRPVFLEKITKNVRIFRKV